MKLILAVLLLLLGPRIASAQELFPLQQVAVAAPPAAIAPVIALCGTGCALSPSAPAHTVVGSLAVTTSPNGDPFTGNLTPVAAGGGCSGGDTADFEITGSAPTFTLAAGPNGGPPVGSYVVCAQGSGSYTNSPQTTAINVSVVQPTIGTTTLPCGGGPTITAYPMSCFIVAGAPGALGTLSTSLDNYFVHFAGNYALVASGCADPGDTTDFSLAGSTISAAATPAGTYHVCTQVNLPGAKNTPQYQEFTVVSSATSITVNGMSNAAIVPGNGSSPTSIHTMTVSVTGGPGTSDGGDWIAIEYGQPAAQNPAPASVQFPQQYVYLTCNGSKANPPQTSATCTLPTPDYQAGTYWAYFLRSDNTLLASTTFTMGQTFNEVFVDPHTFTGGPNFSGKLKAVCTQDAICPGTLSYALVPSDPACPTNNNGSFTLSGNTLSANGAQPQGSYVACVGVSSSGGVTNTSLAVFPVTVSSALPTATNCPTTPPGPAARAGYTTRAYCLDPPKALYANMSNWIHCDYSKQPVPSLPTQLWADGYYNWEPDCGVSQGVPWFKQATDPATGKTVLDFHWNSDVDPLLAGPQGFVDMVVPPSSDGSGAVTNSYPMSVYIQARFKLVPSQTAIVYGCCHPDFFGWNLTGDSLWGHTEIDHIESVDGNGAYDGIFECASDQSNSGNNCAAESGFFETGSSGTNALFANNVGMRPYHDQFTIGWMVTTNGTTDRQSCWYWNDNVVNDPPHSCPGTLYTFSGNNTGALRELWAPILWIGGSASKNYCSSFNYGNYTQACIDGGGYPDMDTIIEYYAVWSCPAWNNFTPHDGSGVTSQVACPNKDPLPY